MPCSLDVSPHTGGGLLPNGKRRPLLHRATVRHQDSEEPKSLEEPTKPTKMFSDPDFPSQGFDFDTMDLLRYTLNCLEGLY